VPQTLFTHSNETFNIELKSLRDFITDIYNDNGVILVLLYHKY